MIKEQYDYLHKLVLIGDLGVGKSSILLRFTENNFSEKGPTVGADFKFKTLPIEGKKVRLQIWDTAGQERFKTITSAYYKGADGIVLVYDVADKESFESLEQYWLHEVQKYGEKNAQVVIIGNKNDLKDQKQVETTKVEEYCNSHNILFWECSAKTADHVDEIFVELAQRIFAKNDQQINN